MKPIQTTKLYEKMIQSIRDGDAQESQRYLKDILFLGYTIDDVIDHIILPTIEEVSEKFHTEDFYITDVLLASRAINACFMDLE
ncbi:MAG: B12-binding domain-containing protein, partial [Eubacterium sp.]